MRARTTLTAAAIAAAAALLLGACSSDAKSSDTIKGAQTGPAPSPTASVADAAHRPKITLPADVHDVFEDTSTGDPTKNAIWHDAGQLVMARDQAIADANPRLPALFYYSVVPAQYDESQSVVWYVTNGYTVTGTDRYYPLDITVSNDTASLNFCSDESKGFDKVRKTGKVMLTPVDANSYVLYETRLKRNSAGVWQTTSVITKQGAAQCGS